ncbi:MAG: Dihydrolipoyllysine-residue acetyltransferase component of pyruvate dehydrogenase complex [Bacteroidetes bacterium ADurb.BinA261]|jgi:pyruvate dehydrogenase E2 component (dihydrolipoamide acetyltransferase)|nr:dihydrolipoamide acetyltransferase [Dysgonamonadaceae bacterium]OPZ12196.1 MAG: Dihydrolipoyllysine-residue acetyltransferase component of pyruvate dehydrogenase complex [Bacteroidetes bacterium ADurb.BinA261]
MEETKLRATPAARALARRLGVDLSNVIGTGYKGRIHRDDVAGFNFEDKIHISPLAKRIAEDNQISLKGIRGSGRNGKIMKDDVIKLIADPELKARLTSDYFAELSTPKAPSQATAKMQNTTQQAVTPSTSAATQSQPAGETEIVALSQMRKIISKRMTESFYSAPTFTQTWEVDMTEMLALRAKLLDPIREKTGKKLTVTDLISMSVVRTLLKHKYINASLNKEATEITFHNYVNLGIAVGMDEGLLVPVVKNADKMSLSEFVVAIKDLTERTFSKKLLPDEQSGSTFTISNLGMYGVDNFTAIINMPNAAILSVAATKDTLVAYNGEPKIRPIMKMSLTCDHRIIDGLTGAKFMADLKASMENPLSLFI